MSHEEVLSIALAIVAGAAVLLWLIPGHCQCEKCGFHVNETRMKREADRVKYHRERHSAFRIPWDAERCPTCKQGHLDDQP